MLLRVMGTQRGRSFLSLLVISLLGLARGGADPVVPLPMWGEIVGPVPASLVAILQTDGGQTISTAAARIKSDTGRVYYYVDWPAAVVRPAVARKAPLLALGFRFDGAPPQSALPVEASAGFPERLNLVNGQPVLPVVSFAAASAVLDAQGGETFTCTLANSGTDAAPGVLTWLPLGSTEAGPSAPIEIAARGFTTTRLAAPLAAGTRPATIWSARFEGMNRAEPVAMMRARLMRRGQALADDPTSSAPAATAGDKGLNLATGQLPLAQGQYLELQLQYGGGSSGAAAAIAGAALSSAGSTAGASLRLDSASVTTIGGGGLWVSGHWFVERAGTFEGARLTSPLALPAGPWILHFLGANDLYPASTSF